MQQDPAESLDRAGFMNSVSKFPASKPLEPPIKAYDQSQGPGHPIFEQGLPGQAKYKRIPRRPDPHMQLPGAGAPPKVGSAVTEQLGAPPKKGGAVTKQPGAGRMGPSPPTCIPQSKNNNAEQ